MRAKPWIDSNWYAQINQWLFYYKLPFKVWKWHLAIDSRRGTIGRNDDDSNNVVDVFSVGLDCRLVVQMYSLNGKMVYKIYA